MGDVNRIFKSLILLYQHLLSLKEEEVLHPLLAVSFLYTRSCTRLDKLYNCCRIENSHRDGIYHCRTENLNPDVTWCEGQPCQQALCPAGSIALVEEEKTESFRNWRKSTCSQIKTWTWQCNGAWVNIALIVTSSTQWLLSDLRGSVYGTCWCLPLLMHCSWELLRIWQERAGLQTLMLTLHERFNYLM